MRNSVERFDEIYLNKSKSAVYKEMLDQQIKSKRTKEQRKPDFRYANASRQKRQLQNTKYQWYGKNSGKRLQTLQSRYIPISKKMVSQDFSNYPQEDSCQQSETQMYLLECQRLIQNLKKFNQKQQSKLRRRKTNYQISPSHRNRKAMLASPYKRYDSQYSRITNQQNGFFNDQDSFKNFYRGKSSDIRPVYKGLKDKMPQNLEELGSSTKIPKNTKLSPLDRNKTQNSTKIKSRYTSIVKTARKDLQKQKLVQKANQRIWENQKQQHNNLMQESQIRFNKKDQKQHSEVDNNNSLQANDEEKASYDESEQDKFLNNQFINGDISQKISKIKITQNKNGRSQIKEDKLGQVNNPQQTKKEKIEKLTTQVQFQKRQGVLRHLKIAKKKGSILFKKIQQFKKNRQIQNQRKQNFRHHKSKQSTQDQSKFKKVHINIVDKPMASSQNPLGQKLTYSQVKQSQESDIKENIQNKDDNKIEVTNQFQDQKEQNMSYIKTNKYSQNAIQNGNSVQPKDKVQIDQKKYKNTTIQQKIVTSLSIQSKQVQNLSQQRYVQEETSRQSQAGFLQSNHLKTVVQAQNKQKPAQNFLSQQNTIKQAQNLFNQQKFNQNLANYELDGQVSNKGQKQQNFQTSPFKEDLQNLSQAQNIDSHTLNVYLDEKKSYQGNSLKQRNELKIQIMENDEQKHEFCNQNVRREKFNTSNYEDDVFNMNENENSSKQDMKNQNESIQPQKLKQEDPFNSMR